MGWGCVRCSDAGADETTKYNRQRMKIPGRISKRRWFAKQIAKRRLNDRYGEQYVDLAPQAFAWWSLALVALRPRLYVLPIAGQSIANAHASTACCIEPVAATLVAFFSVAAYFLSKSSRASLK
jgi:hypothetical protein